MFDKGLLALRAKAKPQNRKTFSLSSIKIKYKGSFTLCESERESYVASRVILRKFDALFG